MQSRVQEQQVAVSVSHQSKQSRSGASRVLQVVQERTVQEELEAEEDEEEEPITPSSRERSSKKDDVVPEAIQFAENWGTQDGQDETSSFLGFWDEETVREQDSLAEKDPNGFGDFYTRHQRCLNYYFVRNYFLRRRMRIAIIVTQLLFMFAAMGQMLEEAVFMNRARSYFMAIVLIFCACRTIYLIPFLLLDSCRFRKLM